MSNHRTLQNIGIVFARLIAGALLGFFTTSYLARMLGPTDNGAYALIVLLPAMAVAFGGFGLSSAVVFIIGKKQYHFSEVLAKLISASTLISIAIVGLLLALPERILGNWFPEIPKAVVSIGIATVPLLILYTNLIAVFQGQQNFKRHGLITLLPIVITLTILLLFSDKVSDKLQFAVLAWGSGYLLTLVLIFLLIRAELRNFFTYATKQSNILRESFQFGFKTYAGNLITFLNYRINFYLLGAVVGTKAVGIYAVTVPITEAVWLIATAVSTVLFPLIASLSTREGGNTNPTPFISRWVFVSSCVVGIVIALLANNIIHIAFGAQYSEAIVAMYLLLPGVVLFSVTKVLSSDIAGRGKPEINLYVTLVSLLVNLALCYMLLPRYGLTGGAMAVSLTYCFYTIVICVIYSKLVDIRVSELFLPQASDFQVFSKLLKSNLQKG